MRPDERILVVDDDASVRDAIRDYLGQHGYQVRSVSGGAQMDQALRERPADLIILDLMMPGENGLAICQRLGRDGPPVIMLSALAETADRVVGLEIGAADYLVKPFDPRELLARVRAVLRRGAVDPGGEGRPYLFDGWRFDADDRRLKDPGGREIRLTFNEQMLLRAFAERPGRLLTRDMLMELTKGPDAEPFDRAVDLAISRLRRKLEPSGGSEIIETVRGEGYRFRPKVRRS